MNAAVRRPVLVGAGATLARGLLGVLARAPAGRSPAWSAVNYRGAEVSLLAGPVAVLAAAAGAAAGHAPPRLRAAAVVAGCGAAVVGRYDDRYGAARDRGFTGHLDALAHGRISTGLVKIVGIGATGLAAGALARRRALDVLLTGAVVAATANLVNLLDLRPGRALKCVLVIGAPVLCLAGPPGDVLAGPVGAAAGLLAADLAETTMLGDAGANGLGAVLGVALAADAEVRRLAVLLVVLFGLTAASETVSFNAVIDRVGVLRRLDRLGARPRPG